MSGVYQNRLRISAANTLFPFVFYGASVDEDPNECLWDNTRAHYMIANVKSHGDNWDPNNGMVGVWMHGDLVSSWTAYDFEYQLNSGWISITSYSGFTWLGMVTKQRYHWGYPLSMIDPNSPWLVDPNLYGNPAYYTEQNVWTKDARIPHWMVLQFDPYGTHWNPNYPSNPNDPNCHWLRGAMWTGGKYAWDGTWTIQANCVGDMLGEDVTDPIGGDFPFDPNLHMDLYLHPNGTNAVAAFSGGQAKQPQEPFYVVDASYDDFENRTGYFTNVSHTLTLAVGHTNWGSVTVVPDLLDDPNHDPNSYSEVRRYTNGTEIVLTATPVSGKSFKEWTIYDPNYPGDLGHASADSNTVLYLTMNANWQVDADFKCGSGMEPFVAVALLALAVGVVVRRLT
jgi:hypothetical protein